MRWFFSTVKQRLSLTAKQKETAECPKPVFGMTVTLSPRIMFKAQNAFLNFKDLVITSAHRKSYF